MNQIKFDNVETFDDWDIYLSSYSVGDAAPKENYVDIPFADGSLDLTEALTGEVSYQDRPFEAIFTLKPPRSNWDSTLSEMRAFLNGRKRKIRVPDSPNHYLIGRCKTEFKKDGVLGIFTVTATCEPWLYKDAITKHNLTIGSTGTININLKNSRKRVIPIITNSAEITVSFNGKSTVVSAGSHRFTSVILVDGDNPMTITGIQGTTVTIEYQEGAL